MPLPTPCGNIEPIQASGLLAMVCIANLEAQAEIAAAYTVGNAQIARSSLISGTNVQIGLAQATTDQAADALRIGGQAYGAQTSASAQITANTTVVVAREAASQATNAAQTAAAQLVSVARVSADYQIASAQIAGRTTTTNADVTATQTVSTARIAALTLTVAADIGAAQTNQAAQISGLQLDWQTRLITTQILVTARVASALAESNAQVTYEGNVAAANISSANTEANARISADGSIASARIAAAQSIELATIAAASTRADADIATSVISVNASIAAVTTETQAQLTVIGIDPSNQVADIDLEATSYAAHQAFLAKEFGATVAYNAGVTASNLQLQGTTYTATQRLAGVQYTSDRDTLATETVATIRATASEYASTRQLQGTEYSATSDLNRFELKLGFAQQQFELVWALVSSIIDSLPLTVQTPGYSAPPPAIGVLDAMPPVDSTSYLSSEGAAIASKAAGEASRLGNSLQNLGYASNNPLGTLLSSMISLEGAIDALDESTAFTLGLASMNGKQLLASQTALAAQIEHANRVALHAEENLVARQTGLLAAIPRILSVNSGA